MLFKIIFVVVLAFMTVYASLPNNSECVRNGGQCQPLYFGAKCDIAKLPYTCGPNGQPIAGAMCCAKPQPYY